jgi:hypothetical protein
MPFKLFLCFAMQLRSLDLSGSGADDHLLLWLAQRSCARLQRLVLAGCERVTGVGLAALLLAKRALLHWQGCGRACTEAGTGQLASGACEPAGQAPVLPLLELVASGTAAFGGPAALRTAADQDLEAWQVGVSPAPTCGQ